MSVVMHGEQDFNKRFGFRAKGSFKCRNPFEFPLAIICLIMMVLGDGFILINGLAIAASLYNYLAPFVIGVIWSAVCITLFSFAHIGITYRYTADEKEFHVFEPQNREEIFYYADVVSIEYKPAKYITGKQHGWIVTITSRYGKKKTYVLVYERNRTRKETQDTPFYIIEQRMISAEEKEND